VRTAEELALLMAASGPSRDEQIRQTRFRLQLVKDWQIPLGARVLEIGCGQGDTTAVLAEAVGPTGLVVAVDLADPSYGAPVNLGDSARFLSGSDLGDRIEFHFGFDVMDPANAFPADSFDFIVLAHCTWYFSSLDRLQETLAYIRLWGRKLCLSEWDLQPLSIDQLGHLLAVLIQGQVESYKTESEANIRTPYSREALHAILENSGWQVATEHLVDASELADGRWEVGGCLASSLREAEELGLPPKLRSLLGSQVDVLRRLSKQADVRPLPSYSILATRL